MAKKIKLTRKQIKKPDEFLTWSEEVWEWLENNYIYALGILVGGVAVLLLLQQGIKALLSAPDLADEELAKAVMVMKKPIKDKSDFLTDGYFSETERTQAAIDALSAFTKKYKDKPQGDMALLFLSRNYEQAGDYPAALEVYTRLSNSRL
ncbi:MAG: tetratricopeptide repeat protein, partial [Rubrivivax sp.]|nr:tetratricopeptide repeat protein [Rubrivivax sp.]